MLNDITAEIEPEIGLPEGVPPLTSLYLYISGACNLACRHCWITPTYQAGANGNRFVRLEYVEKALRQARPLGLRSAKLTGGEPMLHPRFREIVDLIDRAGIDIMIETNGTLLDPELAQYLKPRRVGFISVSLDGATAETHEALRVVPGSFDQAIAGIRALVEAGFRPQMICTLHQGNISQIADVVALAERLGCGSVKFNHVQQIGRGERYFNEYGLDVGELIQIYHRVETELKPLSKIPILFDIPMAFFPIRKLLNDSLGRCTVLNILGVLASGELSLCGIGETVPELLFGHLKSENLGKVWCYNPILARLREQIPDQLEGICGQCLHRDICLGACIANNYHTSGRLTAPYFFCEIAESVGLFPVSRKKSALA